MKCYTKTLLIGLLVLGFSIPSFAELKIFTLQHRFANDLIPIVSPLAGENGTVTGVNNQLIVRTTAENMREIEAIVSQLDTERINRTITVRSNQSGNTHSRRIEANGQIKTGKVIIGNNQNRPNNGVNIDLDDSQNQAHQNVQQFIKVLDGERAFIRVGEIVPYTQDWVSITQHHVHVVSTTDWQEISTGFAVRPRTIGNQVELEITPRIAKLNTNQFIDFEELSTVIKAHLGEWVDIGGTMQQKDDVSRKILGFTSSNSITNSALMIKVD